MPKLIHSETRSDIIIPDCFTISISDVEFKLSKVKLNKSVGPDEVHNWAPLLAPPLASIFNASVREGCVPKYGKEQQ